ncbi:3-hydroxyacyl-CoA dehydrogenase family protein [Nocardiopsis sp. CNS-639]|uniref:3-hydroxyacyl-CoA dehydrogenase family protein n=1 Tax=Nocardiopsis sp. CNS-639 TaxID=1169153 RepID=UPI000375A0EC|nr:3-hydroxyacyl-CoA dehydrogenase family protein [Nocardiopsis sp. CNS-639]
MATQHRLAVLGAGVMGANIAALAIGHGISTLVIDTSTAALAEVKSRIRLRLQHARLMDALPDGRTEGELTTAGSIAALGDAIAVVEAVTELAEVKKKALAEAEAAVPPGTPLITNTSGIPINELANALTRPGELVGVHFMNPTYLIPMVEVVQGPRSTEAAMRSVLDLLADLGREAVTVGDGPGFVTSRLLHPMINDAARVVAEGTADAASVDRLLQGCLGHSTGPLYTADIIGIDNLVDALTLLHERTGDERTRPCDLLLRMRDEGRLGRKSGRGFYEYEKEAT